MDPIIDVCIRAESNRISYGQQKAIDDAEMLDARCFVYFQRFRDAERDLQEKRQQKEMVEDAIRQAKQARDIRTAEAKNRIEQKFWAKMRGLHLITYTWEQMEADVAEIKLALKDAQDPDGILLQESLDAVFLKADKRQLWEAMNGRKCRNCGVIYFYRKEDPSSRGHQCYCSADCMTIYHQKMADRKKKKPCER